MLKRVADCPAVYFPQGAHGTHGWDQRGLTYRDKRTLGGQGGQEFAALIR